MSFKQYIVDAAKDAPIAGIAGASLFGMTLESWVWVLGALYAVGRLLWFGVECYWKWKDRRSGKQASV